MRIEHPLGATGDERTPGDRRDDGGNSADLRFSKSTPDEPGAQDALVHELLTDRQLTPCHTRRHASAGAGSTGRSVQRAGQDHRVAARGTRRIRVGVDHHEPDRIDRGIIGMNNINLLQCCRLDAHPQVE